MSDSSNRFYAEGVTQALKWLQEPQLKLSKLEGAEVVSPQSGLHLHPCSEINVYLKGRSALKTGERSKQTFEAGELCIIPPYCAHVAEPEDGAAFLAVINEEDGVSLYSPFGQRGKLSFIHEPIRISGESIDLNRYICDTQTLLEESDQNMEMIRRLLIFYFERLAGNLARPGAIKSKETKTLHPKVRECLNFLEANIAQQNLSVQMIATHLELHPDYLSNLFSNEMPTTLARYIRRERILLAQKYIRQTALTVKEIAWNCGFSDASYFTKTFREYTGLTPKAYGLK